MPIPFFKEEAIHRAPLQLVKEELSSAGLHYPRLMAHTLDFLVVRGFSSYVAKFFSVILLSFQSEAFASAGKVESQIFRTLSNFSHTELFAASFASFTVIYFVGLPLVMGRTPGLGLFGLRITSKDGSALTVRHLSYRLFGCIAAYASFGVLCLTGLRSAKGFFWHDEISKTAVVRN